MGKLGKNGLVDTAMRSKMISRRRFLQAALAGGLFTGINYLSPAFAKGLNTQSSWTSANRGSRLEAGSPSLTALSAAMQRAAHQIMDRPLILDDPIALRIIGAENERTLRLNPSRFNRSPLLRAFITLRSRYAEDQLALAIQRGLQQYVILGAGLDTFPYRNPYPKSELLVFEVDHPSTQVWKRQRLSQSDIPIPESLVFAPVDFERQTLGDGLKNVGFLSDKPAFFSCLGVVIYLTKPAVMETLGYVASLSPGSEIVFDYTIPPSLLGFWQRMDYAWRAGKVAAIGEPWITFFEPSSLASDLHRMGFKHIEDLGPQEANQRYFKGRTDGLRVAGPGHLMKAQC